MSCRTAGVPGKGHNSRGASPFLSWQIRVFRQPPCSQRGSRPVFPMGLLLPSVEYLCQPAPGGAARYFPCTEKGKGACQRPVSEFIHVSILNFAAPGNSRSENEVQHRSFVTRQEAFSRAMTARIVGRGCTLCGSCPCGRFYSLK